MNSKIIILLILVAVTACKPRNRLNTDEGNLAQEILKSEEEKKESAETNLIAANKSTSPVPRMEEDRSPDEANPPVVIDILSGRENPVKVNTSDLFSEIQYIKLQPVPDSSFYESGIDILISNKFIYGYSANGIAQFSFDGHFIKYICKNESYFTKHNGTTMVTSEQYNMFVGATNLKLIDGKLYYKYEDRPAKFACLMEYDEVAGSETFSLPLGQENNQNIRGLGEPIMNIPPDNKMYTVNDVNPLGNGLVGFSMRRKSMNEQRDFVTVTSISGDTVCSMKDYDPIVNYTKSVGRGAESAYNYYLDGVLHLRQIYNDTIYKLIPPNQLVPKYILDFGKFGIESSLEAMDPGFSLADKYVSDDFLETSRYLFFTYTKDYACPNTAKNGTLKYSRFIYKKQEKKVIYIYTDESAYYDTKLQMTWPSAPDLNLENDFDGSLFLWPVRTTSFGLPYSVTNGKYLYEKTESRDFGGYKNLSDQDFVITLYK